MRMLRFGTLGGFITVAFDWYLDFVDLVILHTVVSLDVDTLVIFPCAPTFLLGSSGISAKGQAATMRAFARDEQFGGNLPGRLYVHRVADGGVLEMPALTEACRDLYVMCFRDDDAGKRLDVHKRVSDRRFPGWSRVPYDPVTTFCSDPVPSISCRMLSEGSSRDVLHRSVVESGGTVARQNASESRYPCCVWYKYVSSRVRLKF